MKKTYRLNRLLLVVFFSVVLNACHDEEPDEDALNPYVDTPAYPILTGEGSLHIFKFKTFVEDVTDIRNDLMVLSFDNFTPASTNVEPDKDEVQTLNDLGWTKNSWDEGTVNWLTIAAPKADANFQKTRQYRILKNNQLSAPSTVLNQPTYEAIDENVYERQLGAVFVWDFNNYTNKKGEDISNDEIGDYEKFQVNETLQFDLLKNASIWGHHLYFSNGATIYGATRSIAADAIVVEAVDKNGFFSLAQTKIAPGIADIESMLSTYSPDAARLEYRFTLDYENHSTIYMSFDGENAYLSNTSNGSVIFTVPYTIHADLSYVEIDTSGLSESERIILGGLPVFFNPVIVGPFTDDGSSSDNIADKAYYYGKHYIKTTEDNRLKLQPVFFFNATAKNDIQNAFKQWRIDRHLEEGI